MPINYYIKFLLKFIYESKALLLIVFFLHCILLLPGQYQPTPVEKSDQKILYQGKTYYVHTIKQGQTLYSICKAYGVSQQQIAESNPGIKIDPLPTGQNLKIPVMSETKPVDDKPKTDPKQDRDFIYHTVRAKETPYFLHQKYNVPLEAIYQANPGSENGIREGQIIRIPRKSYLTENPVPEPVQQEVIKQYTVRQGDSLYRIAEDYGLTVGDLINANRELRWGFRPGQVIIIPVSGISEQQLPGFTDSLFTVSAQLLSSFQCDSISSLKRMRPGIKVAIMLPFFVNESFTSDSLIDSDSIADNGIRTDRKTFKGLAAVEFYEGFLLAVDSLKKKNVSINLFVYDTEADTNRVKTILKDLNIIEPDLIVGPLTPDNIRIVSKFAFEHKILLVPPLLAGDTTLRYNPLLVQPIPSHEEELDLYTRYIAQYSKKNIIIASKPGFFNQQENEHFKDYLRQNAALYYGVDSLVFHEVEINDNVKTNLNHILKKDDDNIVIILSTYEPDVINVMSHLHFMLREYSIQVFGFPQWQRFDNVRIEVMHELQVTLYSPFYINYNSSVVKSFVKTCRNKLKYEPFKTTAKGTGINYAFLGYDIGIYFLEAFYSYQKNTCDCLEYKKEKLLLSDYDYEKNNRLGIIMNKHISLLRFNKSYEVELINFR